MGRFTAVFIGVSSSGEDGGENARTIAFWRAREARGRNQRPKLGHVAMLHTTAKLRLRVADMNRAGQTGPELRQDYCRGQQLAPRSNSNRSWHVKPQVQVQQGEVVHEAA